MTAPWKPSRPEQRLLWWLQMLLRFAVGGGGLVWELLVDRLRNPVALLVFGTLATSTDVFGFARQLIRQARENALLEREELRECERAQKRKQADSDGP